MIKGLLVLCCAGVVGLVGCSGGSSAPVGDGSPSDDGKGASTANLPKKSDGTPAKADKPASGGGAPAPAGNPAGQPGQPADPADPADPGGGGQNGQPGQNGRSSVNNSCCYNGTELACDAVQCFGGFDEEACESKCNQNDFDCLIGCVHKLGSAPPPTAQCKATGKKC